MRSRSLRASQPGHTEKQEHERHRIPCGPDKPFAQHGKPPRLNEEEAGDPHWRRRPAFPWPGVEDGPPEPATMEGSFPRSLPHRICPGSTESPTFPMRTWARGGGDSPRVMEQGRDKAGTWTQSPSPRDRSGEEGEGSERDQALRRCSPRCGSLNLSVYLFVY